MPIHAHLSDAPQQELTEAAGLFDLPEHRFYNLLMKSAGHACHTPITATKSTCLGSWPWFSM
jgi:hypothetical protein